MMGEKSVRGARRHRWRRLVIVLHRDIGYFLSGLVVVYCLSGLALNHVDDWNPDFVIEKRSVKLTENLDGRLMTPEDIKRISGTVGEDRFKLYDQPTPTQVKIYFDNATLHLDLEDGEGIYERVSRRPVFYQSNVIHRNSLKGWKWAADIFSVLLVVIVATGLMMVKGPAGFWGRGKWFVLAGMVPPVAAIVLFEILQ
jgi:hypothetical protein